MSVDPCGFHPLPHLLLTVGSSMRGYLWGSSVECGIPPVIIYPVLGSGGHTSSDVPSGIHWVPYAVAGNSVPHAIHGIADGARVP